MRRLQHKTSLDNEQGIISITVALVFIMVISLITLGYSEVTRRNAREALDRHLSSQAYYAAETGVNDAVRKIVEQQESGQDIVAQDQCKDESKYTRNGGNVDTAEEGVLYSCLLVDPTPDTLSWDHVNDSSIVTPVSSAAEGTPIGEYVIKWQRTAANVPDRHISNCRVNPNTLPSSAAWNTDYKCPFGLLRVDLTPVSGTGSSSSIKDAATAAQSTMTLFMYPKPGPIDEASLPSVKYELSSGNIFGQGVQQQGITRVASCDNETCAFKLTDLNFEQAYLRIRTIYVDAKNLQVSNPSGIRSSQIVVDVTGKAQDVLRRIQVRYPIAGSSRTDRNTYSDYAVQSSKSICKRYVISPEYAENRAGANCSN